jgi:hypothetical protein
MEKFNKWWNLITVVTVAIIGAAGWLYTQGQESNSLDGRTFDSTEQKIQHIIHVKSVLNPTQQREKQIFDSIQIAEIKGLMEKSVKDNKDIKKHIHNLDSLVKQEAETNVKNADQLYQIKEKLNN